MEHPGFFDRQPPIALGELARATGCELKGEGAAEMRIADVRPLDLAGPADVSFVDNRKYLPQFGATRAGACFVAPPFVDRAPANVRCLVTPQPYHAFARALALFYPQAAYPRTTLIGAADGPVASSARLEKAVTVEAGAIIGAEAQIGAGTVVASGAVIGYRVHIGRNGYVGPGAVLTHALIGNNVVIHAGVKIGQDGFGFAIGRNGHLKVPQVGRVVIQDNVEIGANTTIDRGALKDTTIGEGTKIDNLVQIGHNVTVGRHCLIVAQTGISGSTELGDFVVMGGQSGTVGHIKLGNGAQVAGNSGVKDDIPAGERWGGTPARPMMTWAREMATLKALAARKKAE
jgi:UDP-3-O-[3-hydroxymyristoyl] glucosamine N-acyltransferase